jgi:predicted transcriptional regulator
MATNSEIFLNGFNDFEKYLQDKFNNGNYMSYRDLIRQVSYKNGIIKKFKRDLYVFGDLRNVLVHNTRINGKIIAEPINDLVSRFDYITKQIKYPEKVDKFKRKIYFCSISDKLSKALQFMHEHKISQIPVVENNKIIDVLNGNHISMWLASKKIADISEVTINDVLSSAERRFNFEIIAESTPIYQAAGIYRQSFQKPPVNWYYDALLITQNGAAEEIITGIIVLKDIAEYMHE